NIITNSNPTIANNVIKDAITASTTATVNNNTLTNITGFAINGGKSITNNIITNLETIISTGTAENNYAIKASTGQSAVIQNNTILYPIGFVIQNGKTIKNNTITGGTNNIATNNYAIRAEAGAEVSNNVIKDIKGIGIENGILIHNNTVTNVINYIKADGNAVITHNTLKGGLLAYESTANYAILNGSIINSNTIKGITSAGTTNLISSAFMTEFNNNIIGGDNNDDINEAQNILEATKAGATSLTIDGNIFENNQYRNDAIKVTSANIAIKNNQILNDYEVRAGGFIGSSTASGTGVALYVKANNDNAVIQGNTITGHLGSKDGAALYLESVAASKVVVKSNIISNNHIIHVEGRGAAIFHNGLGILEIDNNTITFNYIPEEGNDSSIGSAIYSAGTTPPVSGSLKINNNIIASNGGKWAIYGRPSQMTYNNLYDNTIDGKEEVWTGIDQNHGMNLKLSPATANYTINATNNFWGTRSDLGNIDPSIFDDNEQASLPAVVYQPLLTGPSLTTPGTVSNINAVSVTSSEDLTDLTGIINLPISTTIWATIQAKDNNQYSNDYTEVIVQNTNSGQYLSLLLKEKGKNATFNTEVYKDSFSLCGTASDYDPVNKVLPVTSGDQIVIVSSSDPSKRVTLNANLTGNALINPYVNVFDFGTWADASAITKTFTLTNSGAVPLVFASSNAVQITGTYAAQFALTAASYDSTSIAPGASVDIVVTYTAASTPATHTADLEIDFTDDSSDRTIVLSGTSITAWTGLANNDQFGEPVIKTNQMTLNINQVNINGSSATGGDRIAAYVVTGLKEELRGNAVVQNNSSATLVVQTDIANETIIFKVWDATNYILYDSPNTIISAPGTIVNSRAPIVIDGLSKLTLSGTVLDDGSEPLPEAILVNRHADADINPNTNIAYEYNTFADGSYAFMVWRNTPMILNAELAGYTFVANKGVGSTGTELNVSTT
ncbi:MAG TPA: DUF1573 domain-containing protein, partial [Candidatus Cloacimonadota bacterium]|nr:DUF1573 domain-containing protein [Candidatus Cloacimonadota bacterium]